MALLIDWENLKWALQHTYGQPANISSLLEAARGEGRLVTARAYADWTQRVLSPDAANLFRSGIDPVFAPARYGAGDRQLKNSADVRLAVDAVDLCRQLTHVSTYVLVTGDGDLVHAVNYLRLNGRRVVVIATRAALSRTISAAADAVIVYDEALEPTLRAPALAPPAAGAPPNDDAVADASPAPDAAPAPPSDGTAPAVAPAAAGLGAVLTDAQRAARDAELVRVRALIPPTLAAAGRTMTLAEFGNLLRVAHRVDARTQFGIGLKQLVARVARPGGVQLWTEGGVDYVRTEDGLVADAADVGDPPPMGPEAVASDGAAEGATRAPEGRAAGDVTLDSLDASERGALAAFLWGKRHYRDYITFLPLRDFILRDGVLPRLERGQIGRLLNDLVARGVLRAEDAQGTKPDTGEPYRFKKLFVQPDHPLFAAASDGAADA